MITSVGEEVPQPAGSPRGQDGRLEKDFACRTKRPEYAIIAELHFRNKHLANTVAKMQSHGRIALAGTDWNGPLVLDAAIIACFREGVP
jgi:hypothetical protein